MKNNLEKMPSFRIEKPKVGDEKEIGQVHLESWRQTYVNKERGIDIDLINKIRGDVTTKEGDEFRRNIFEKLEDLKDDLYRVAKNSNGKIIGFLHCTKNVDFNELGAIYLLDEAKGQGIGDKLMEEFLSWIDKDKPCITEVFLGNDRAIKFYEKYGFKPTRKAGVFKDAMEYIEMIRPSKGY